MTAPDAPAVPGGDVEKTIALMRISESVTISGPLLAAMVSEYDRRGQIERRAVEVATHPAGVDTKSLAARSRTRRHVACHILGWSS